MEFWGVEVKSGQPLEVDIGDGKFLHLSQASLGEIKNTKTDESVCLHINIKNKKLVLGTLNSKRLPQQLFDLNIDTKFQLSHNWKNSSVYFYGYIADGPFDDDDDDSESEDNDTDEEEEAPTLPVANGLKSGKQQVKKEDDQVATKKKDVKQKVKIVEPEKEKEADEDDSDASMSEDSDSEEGEDDSSDKSEESSEDEEETPKKQQSGKKRPNESAMKTPAIHKKAKLSTPQKTDGKKTGGHVATPHPSKQVKTPAANKSNQKTPASASTDSPHSCKSCNKTFKSDHGLKSHNQDKHK